MGKATNLIPINKFLLLEKIVQKDTDLVLPENANLDRAGKIKLKVIAKSEDCTKVNLGDFVITAGQGTIGAFKYSDKEYHITNEDAVAVVIREKQEG